MKKISTSDLITQSEAARIRGVSRQAINNLVKKGRVKSVKISSIIFVEREEIIKFEALNAGRPKKEKNG